MLNEIKYLNYEFKNLHVRNMVGYYGNFLSAITSIPESTDY